MDSCFSTINNGDYRFVENFRNTKYCLLCLRIGNDISQCVSKYPYIKSIAGNILLSPFIQVFVYYRFYFFFLVVWRFVYFNPSVSKLHRLRVYIKCHRYLIDKVISSVQMVFIWLWPAIFCVSTLSCPNNIVTSKTNKQ